MLGEYFGGRAEEAEDLVIGLRGLSVMVWWLGGGVVRGGSRILGVAVRRVLRTVRGVGILRLGRLIGTTRRGFNMSTSTPIVVTNTITNKTTRRGARFSMMLTGTNTSGIKIVGTIERMAKLKLGRTGRMISGTPGALGRNISGRRTSRVGRGLRTTKTDMRIG